MDADNFSRGSDSPPPAPALATPALADPAPDVEWRLTSSFVPALDLIYGGAETLAKALADLTDGHFTLKISPAGEIAPALDALDAVADGQGRLRPHRALLLLEQGPELHLRLLDAVRHERAPARGLAQRRRRRRADRRVPRRAQGFRAAGRQHRRADGGLVPQGDPRPARFHGPQDAHRRLRRQGVPDARRRAGRDAEGRHLRRPGRRLARRVRMGRPLRRREVRRAQGRAEAGRLESRAQLLLSRLVEGRHAIASRRRQGQVRRAAEVLSERRCARRRRSPTPRCSPNTTPPIPAR